MQIAPIPRDEAARLAALRRLGILDTDAEERYDRLVRLAAAALRTPIALISIIDENRQWFKARVGLDAAETPRDWAFCSHAIIEPGDGPFIVNDATTDERFDDNPLVTGSPLVRFYAGEVVRDVEGFAIGTICAIDHVQREFDDTQQQTLRDLARLVEYEFARVERDNIISAIQRSERQKAVLLDTLSEGLVVQDLDGAIVDWNTSANELLGLSDEELSGRTSFDPRWRSVHVDGSPWFGDDHPAIEAIRTEAPVNDRTMGVHRPDGSLIWLTVTSRPVKDDHGRTEGALTLFADVAAKFDAARASETMALRLRQAVDSSGIGTALLDGSGSTTFVNDAYSRIVGLPHDQLLGCSPSTWIHPNDPLAGLENFAHLDHAHHTSLSTEIEVAEHHGAAEWVRAHIARLDDSDRGDRFIMQLEDVTERRQLQEEIRESERIARASLDSLEQGVIVADVTGGIHQANRAAVEILGFTPEELTEEFRSGRWTTYDENGVVLPKEQRPIRQVMQTGEPVHRALLGWRHRGGDLLLLRLSCVPVPSDDDSMFKFVVAFADVSEQYRASRLLDAIFATAPVGLAVVEADEVVIRSNPAFSTHTGVPAEDVPGSGISTLLQGELTPAPIEGAPHRHEERLIERSDGSEVWISPRSAHIDDLDRPLDIIATFDITERKRMETDLQHFGHLFRHASDIITVVDETGQVKYASPSNERVLGYPDGWRSPGGVLDLVHPDDLTRAATRFAELLNGERVEEPFLMRLRTFDGQWKSIETVGTNLLDEPSVNGIVLTSRDVTERQLLTDELAHRASHDGLTDLPNRSTVEERLDNALARARREQRRVGLCFLDLDRFKSVNDTLGHAAGDAVLVDVGARLKEVVRASDLAARLGGDEFVIVLDLVDNINEAADAARRIHRHLSDPPVMIGDLNVSVSIGVAVSQPDDTASSLLSRADAALYRAKSTESSSVEVSDAPVAPAVD